MEIHDPTMETESLGYLLRRVRLEKKLDIGDIAEQTKISRRILLAMEADDYVSLPHLSYAKGFYRIYAKLLHLDENEVIRRFNQEVVPNRGQTPSGATLPSREQEDHITNLARPPSHSGGAVVAAFVLLTCFAAAAVVWQSGTGPAKQISNWLQAFEPQPEVIIERRTSTPPPYVYPKPEDKRPSPRPADDQPAQSNPFPIINEEQLVAELTPTNN
jgi:cytoskeletal protein RodZ